MSEGASDLAVVVTVSETTGNSGVLAGKASKVLGDSRLPAKTGGVLPGG